MKKLVIIIVFMIVCGILSFGQYATEALKYSTIMQGGTSRANAMSGSFSAIGGDASAIYFNPASMGIYRSTEITFTPGFEFTNSNVKYLDKNNRDFDFGLNINNLSFVGTIGNFNFGIAYNKLNNFNENIVMQGINNQNSITDWFAGKANGTHFTKLSNFDTGLAWDTYLINPTDSTEMYYVTAFDNYGHEQLQIISRSGYQGEYSFALSGNIGRKLFLGASFGLQTVRFSEDKMLRETDVDNVITNFSSLYFNQSLKVSGTGVNLKFGFLYSPVDWLRFGASFHTPTFYSLDERYSNRLEATTDSLRAYDSPQGNFEYNLNSPVRLNASVGFIINNLALINVDYEFVNYTKARLRADNETFSSDNETIQNYFKAGHNVRIGAEVRLLPSFCLRLGTGFYSSPYKNPVSKNTFTMNYSAGFGIKLGNYFYIDAAYTYFDFGNQLYYMYDGYGISSPKAEIAASRNRLTFTFGFKF